MNKVQGSIRAALATGLKSAGVAGCLLAGLAQGGTVCDLYFPACFDRFASGAITVPQSMVGLSARIPACPGTAQLASGAGAPSIVFLVDNSSSMGMSDPDELRFAAVANLLDDIRAISPSAEAALVLFSRRSQFDLRDGGMVRPIFPADPAQHDAYVPFTALDQPFPGGRTGLDTLKALLRHDDRGNLLHATKQPASRENRELGRLNLRDGSDLSLAFEAARAALATAKAAPAGRYVILLSDGEPASLDQGREALKWDFARGLGLPTTFTVSFDTSVAAKLGDSLAAMNARIRANGYSAGNLRSTAVAMGAPATGLQAHLRTLLFSAPEVPAYPLGARLRVAGAEHASLTVDDGNLIFPAAVPLTEEPAEVSLEVDYSYNPQAAAGITSSFRAEKQVSYALTVRRSAAVTDLPAGLTAFCREQPTVGLYHAGSEIRSLTPDLPSLEARVHMPTGTPCPACKVEISVTSAKAARTALPAADREESDLVAAGGHLAATLLREIAGHPVPGDGRIQHLPGDSLILTWKNPANPLDRVRRAWAFVNPGPLLGLAIRNDFSRTQGLSWAPTQWLLVGAPSLRVAALPGSAAHATAAALPDADSRRYVGLQVEAARAFHADVRVYDNLGQYVNKLTFAVPPSEFAKLPLSPDGRSRRLVVLWDNRAEDGSPAGTGSYVLKSTVTLERLPGLPEEDAMRTQYSRIGVLRSL